MCHMARSIQQQIDDLDSTIVIVQAGINSGNVVRYRTSEGREVERNASPALLNTLYAEKARLERLLASSGGRYPQFTRIGFGRCCR